MANKNLLEQFINAGIRQVGRDGGKVISNIVYGDKHSTPLRNSTSNNEGNIVLPEPQKRNYSYQFVKPKIGVLSKIVWIVPVFGFLTYLIEYLAVSINKGTYLFRWEEENFIPDKRYKEGYRLNGWIERQAYAECELEEAEIIETKNVKKKILLWIIPTFIWSVYVCYYLYSGFSDLE